MKRSIPLIVAAAILGGSGVASAQVDTLSLTLQECIRLARLNGPSGAMARSAYESKESAYHSFTAGNYPQLSLTGDVPGYSRSINPIILPDGTTVFTPQSQASSSLSLSLTQKLPFTGGELSLLS